MASSLKENQEEILYVRNTCHACHSKTDDVDWKCEICKIPLCQSCAEGHILKTLFTEHRVVNTRDGMPILKTVKCPNESHGYPTEGKKMAASSSDNQAQILYERFTCYACHSKNDNVDWKCQNCKIPLCQSCAEGHILKISYIEHRVVNTINGIPILKTVKCPYEAHGTKNVTMFCEKCDDFLCTKCLTNETHEKESLKELDQIYLKIAEKMEKQKSILKEENLNFYRKEIDKLELVRNLQKENYAYQKERILENDKILKDMITSETNELLDDLENHRNYIESEIMNSINEVERKIQQNKKILKLIEKNINTTDIKFFWSFSNIINGKVEGVTPTLFAPLPTDSKSFSKRNVTENEIKSIVGTLENFYVKSKELVDFKVINTYATNLDKISSLSVNKTDNSVWINSLSDKNLRRVRLNNNRVSNLQELKKMTVLDIAVTSAGDLLLALYSKPCIKILKANNNELEDLVQNLSLKKSEKLEPISLHIQSDGTVLIGTMEEKGKTYAPSYSSRRQIWFLSQQSNGYDFTKTLEFDKDGNKLFIYPHKITSNSSGTIYIIDRSASDTGRLISVDSKCCTKWIYAGQTDNLDPSDIANTPNDNKLDPSDIANTPQDNIIINDLSKSMLHILNDIGHLLKYVDTKQFDIIDTYCMDIDHAGRLYIGCEQDHVKIHVLCMSGC